MESRREGLRERRESWICLKELTHLMVEASAQSAE